jgi:hypothetical protein
MHLLLHQLLLLLLLPGASAAHHMLQHLQHPLHPLLDHCHQLLLLQQQLVRQLVRNRMQQPYLLSSTDGLPSPP